MMNLLYGTYYIPGVTRKLEIDIIQFTVFRLRCCSQSLGKDGEHLSLRSKTMYITMYHTVSSLPVSSQMRELYINYSESITLKNSTLTCVVKMVICHFGWKGFPDAHASPLNGGITNTGYVMLNMAICAKQP